MAQAVLDNYTVHIQSRLGRDLVSRILRSEGGVPFSPFPPPYPRLQQMYMFKMPPYAWLWLLGCITTISALIQTNPEPPLSHIAVNIMHKVITQNYQCLTNNNSKHAVFQVLHDIFGSYSFCIIPNAQAKPLLVGYIMVTKLKNSSWAPILTVTLNNRLIY